MNKENICEIPGCDNDADQKITLSSELLQDKGTYEAGDLWNQRSWAYMCESCSSKLFSMYDAFYNHGIARGKDNE